MAWLLIKDGLVYNVIEWDGVAEYTPPEGCSLVEYAEAYDIGWSFVDGVASPPS